MDDLTHPMTWVCHFLRENGCKFIPTIGTERNEEYVSSLQGEVERGLDNGICVRLLKDDLETPKDALREIHEVLKTLKITSSEVHLLIDFKHLETSNVPSAIELLTETENYFTFSGWKSLIISGSGFPENMSGVPTDTIAKIPRSELELWQSALQLEPLLGIKPLYSDYCIVHPEIPDVDPTAINPVGKIRYTTEDSWIIFKGYSLKIKDRYDQYFELAKKVVNHQCFRGSETSWADNHYKKCSEESTSTGNLTTWITVDTNHHLTIVAEQVSKIFDS